MKQTVTGWSRLQWSVTLYVRVWIETVQAHLTIEELMVTLYVRVWIETAKPYATGRNIDVTLYVRVWIEIAQRRRT